MKKLVIIFAILIGLVIVPNHSTAQSWDWLKQNTDGSISQPASHPQVPPNPLVTTDAHGNVYSFSTFDSWGISFGGDTVTELAGMGLILVKFDSNGHVVWTKDAGHTNVGSIKIANALTVDSFGSVYITGECDNTALIFGGITIHTPVPPNNMGMFIAKFDSNGNVKWAKTAGGLGAFNGVSIKVNITNHIYLTGIIGDSDVVFDTITLLHSDNMYLVKYDTGGKVIWARGAFALGPTAMTTDKQGNIIITTMSLNGIYHIDSTVLYIPGDSAYLHLLILKYDSTGRLLWGKGMGGNGYIDEHSVAITTDEVNNIYVSGNTTATIMKFDTTNTFHTMPGNFLLKCSASGDIIWYKQPDYRVALVSLSSDANGYIYACGSDLAYKYDTTANNIWAKELLGCSTTSICASNANHVAVSGFYSNALIHLDGFTLTNHDTLFQNMFVAQLNSNYNSLVRGNSSEVKSNIHIYPNPADKQVTVELPDYTENAVITISDITGGVHEIRVINTGNKMESFDLSAYASGIYVVKVVVDFNFICTSKLFIQQTR